MKTIALNRAPQELPMVMPPQIAGIKVVEKGLPDPDLVSYYRLENDRKIFLEGAVDENVLTVQRMILRWNMEDTGLAREDRKPIRLYIFSYGGDIDYMWSLVDVIEESETPVHTINMGMSASAAGLIFLAGHKRIMLRRSKLLIHEGSAHLTGDAIKVMDASDNYRLAMKQMKDYVLTRTRISASALSKQRGHDWVIDAKYCLEHGACEVVTERLGEAL